MATVLYAYTGETTFTRIDREALAERFDVVDYQQHRLRVRPLELWRKLRQCDVVYCWFAAWQATAAVALAALMGKPSVLVTGGVDTANLPEIGYGRQLGGVRRLATRWTIRRATRLITDSNYLVGELERNVGIPRNRVKVVHHGLRDRFADVDAAAPREPVALSVGVLYRLNLERKGHRPVRARRA